MFRHEFRTMGSISSVTWRCAVWFREHFKEKNVSQQYLEQLAQLETNAEKLLRQIQRHGDYFQQKDDEETIDIKTVDETFNLCAHQSEGYLKELISITQNNIETFSLGNDETIQVMLDRLKSIFRFLSRIQLTFGYDTLK